MTKLDYFMSALSLGVGYMLMSVLPEIRDVVTFTIASLALMKTIHN